MNRNQDIDQDAAFEPDPPMDLCVLGTAGRIVRRVDVAKGRLIAGDASLDRVLLDAADGLIEVSASGNTRIVVSRDAIGWDAPALTMAVSQQRGPRHRSWERNT